MNHRDRRTNTDLYYIRTYEWHNTSKSSTCRRFSRFFSIVRYFHEHIEQKWSYFDEKSNCVIILIIDYKAISQNLKSATSGTFRPETSHAIVKFEKKHWKVIKKFNQLMNEKKKWSQEIHHLCEITKIQKVQNQVKQPSPAKENYVSSLFVNLQQHVLYKTL